MQTNRIELTEDQARQGVTGHGVRYVLGFGLLGAVLALAITFAVLRLGIG
jgi:hypothetical protein